MKTIESVKDFKINNFVFPEYFSDLAIDFIK